VLDAVRLGPTDDVTAVTAAQLRETVDRLREAGHWHPGGPHLWIMHRQSALLVDPVRPLSGRPERAPT
jgi:hypothetical protein